MSTKDIIKSLEDALTNPSCHPDARKGMEERLRHFRRLKAEKQDKSRAIAASIKVRQAIAAKKHQAIMPHLLTMKCKRFTYARMAEWLKVKGYTSLQGTPYSVASIGRMIRNYSI